LTHFVKVTIVAKASSEKASCAIEDVRAKPIILLGKARVVRWFQFTDF